MLSRRATSTTDQNFLNFMQFLGKSGKFVCLRPPELAPCSGVSRIYGGWGGGGGWKGGGGGAPTDYLTKILSNFVLGLDQALYVSIIIFLEEFVKTDKPSYYF